MDPPRANAIPAGSHSVPGRLLTALGLLLAGCGGGEETSPAAVALPAEVVVGDPDRPIAVMDVVEDDSEAVANRFIDFADKLRRRDFRAARDWLVPEFAGHSLDGLAVAERRALPLGVEEIVYDAASAPVVGAQGFVDSCAAWLGPWERVETIVWKVKGADFQAGDPLWGKVHFRITMLGSGPEGGPRSVTAWASARVERRGGNWMLVLLQLESLEEERRARPLFTDVASAAGVAHAGIRFGQAGNRSFAWNGAAGGDADGDGLWDLFVPSEPANFLYMGRARASGELGFDDEAGARGVRDPAGGTGAAFLDYDGDGDPDLALAGVGWPTGGHRLRMWRNGGTGEFEEVGKEVGFGDLCHGYSLAVFDAENDGFLDVFVCDYGRVEAVPNDSWIQATNGSPNRLYHNEGGARFVEVARERGLADTSWSYAAAAADHDLDGDADLYVANDYGRNQMWINDGSGRFTEAAEELGSTDLGNGMGAAWGDLDGDGRLDLYVSNMSSTAGNRILKRMSVRDGTWSELLKLASGNTIFLSDPDHEGAYERLPADRGGIGGSWAWAPALFDLDLDGRLDVYCCSGFVTGDTPADT